MLSRIERHQSHPDWILDAAIHWSSRGAGLGEREDEVGQTSRCTPSHRDKIRYHAQPGRELELVAVRRGTHGYAGGTDPALGYPGAGSAVLSPVEHPSVHRGERLPGEEKLVLRRVRRTAQIEDALDHAVVVEVAAAVLIPASA